MPYFALPFTFCGVSSRFNGLPSSLNSAWGFSLGEAGTACFAALPMSAPYDSLRPFGPSTWLFSVRSSPVSSFQCAAAAATSISRAAAPAWRSGTQWARIVVLPPVACRPNIGLSKALSTGARSTLTRSQSASSSSAISIGIAVSTPCPISAEPHSTVMRLSGVIRNQAFGANGSAFARTVLRSRAASTGSVKPITSAALALRFRKARRVPVPKAAVVTVTRLAHADSPPRP